MVNRPDLTHSGRMTIGFDVDSDFVYSLRLLDEIISHSRKILSPSCESLLRNRQKRSIGELFSRCSRESS